jgi:3-oxoacyl-[acyl-carrier-protein] synthase-3
METLVADFALAQTWPAQVSQRARRPLAATILGTGSYAPEEIVPNDFFVEALGLETTAAWIQQRTGIVQRRRSAPDATASSLAAQAARTALARARLGPEEIELIVVATSSPDYTMPATACLVQDKIGAENAMAFDISNACTGFVYALDIAARYVATGIDKALVLGVDLGSRLVNYEDRGTCIFFGDGAGAIVLGAQGSGRVLASRLHSAGNAEPLSLPVGGAMTMDGRAIWNFATQVLPETVRGLCHDAGVAVSDLKLLVPHQANRNIIEAAALELGLPPGRVAINIEHYGNTLAASIPLALDEALAAGRAAPGDLVALVGFGAGLAWGGLLLEL